MSYLLFLYKLVQLNVCSKVIALLCTYFKQIKNVTISDGLNLFLPFHTETNFKPPLEFQAKANTTIGWCVLDKNNTFAFVHIPHAAESLLECWSWFQTRNKTEECGFYLRGGGVSLKGKSTLMGDWKEALIHSMGCVVTYNKPPAGHHTYYLIKENKPQWFWRKEDIHSLREKFIDFGLVDKSSPSDQVRIGFVDRTTNRRILNMDNITNMARVRYPDAQIEMANMEDLTAIQQMAWWSRQNIVVAAHGAALTNVIFLQNNSAVVEIFPAHYCPIHYFGGLCERTGVRNYGYYSNCTSDGSPASRVYYRRLDMTPPINEIMDLMSKAVIGLLFS